MYLTLFSSDLAIYNIYILMSHRCLCYRTVYYSTYETMVIRCGWEGNRSLSWGNLSPCMTAATSYQQGQQLLPNCGYWGNKLTDTKCCPNSDDVHYCYRPVLW